MHYANLEERGWWAEYAPETMPTCWWCGARPLDSHEITRLGEAEPVFVYSWPPGDHQHRETPPTPSELRAEADQALARQLRILAKED